METLTVTNFTSLPEWAVKAAADKYRRPPGPNVMTVTELIGPPLVARLWRDHGHETNEDVSDMGALLLGNAVHAYFETHGDGARSLHEERLSKAVIVDGEEWIVS